VAVVFFIAIIVGSFNLSFEDNQLQRISFNHMPFFHSYNSSIVSETIEKVTNTKIDLNSYKPTKGILANVFNNVTSSGSFIFGILNSFNQLIFHERIWASIIILLGAILTFLYWLFIRNVFIVGENRFFLENVNYKKTTFRRILLPYRVGKSKNVSFSLLRKTIYEWLSFLTIIGGFVKHYSYALVPYILAENPGINGKDAIKLSENMMMNHKWELFKFDLSFIPWYILNFCTLKLSGIIYSTPYKKSCLAEIYLNLRAEAIENKIPNYELLKDEYLEKEGDTYPKEKYIYEEKNKKNLLNVNYESNYSLTSLILMFFTASIIGWFWEVGLHLFEYGSFVNRGVLHGPWLPIYGWGAVALLVLLRKYRKDPIKTFVLAITICGLIEYGTSWYLEIFKHARWWSYEGFFLNINGRVCLEGLLAFGIGGCAFIYFAAPVLESIYLKTNKNLKIILCIILTLFYLGDTIYSQKKPNTGIGISQNIKEKSL
jgi:uncharacterized membrane protein